MAVGANRRRDEVPPTETLPSLLPRGCGARRIEEKKCSTPRHAMDMAARVAQPSARGEEHAHDTGCLHSIIPPAAAPETPTPV